MKGDRLKVGFAGLYFSNFEAVKYNIFPDSVKGLERLAEDLDFDLCAWPDLIEDSSEAEKACTWFKNEAVDFLLIQASSLSLGEMVLPLVDNDLNPGFWMVPEPEAEGEIALNSMTGFNLGVSIIRQHYPGRKLKWFYGRAEDAEFQRPFAITVKALGCLKKLSGSRIAAADEAVPGFINLTYDVESLKKQLGLEIIKLPLPKLFSEMRESADTKADTVKTIAEEIISISSSVDVPEAELKDTACTAEALTRIGVEDDFQAAALKCWPEFQSEFHMAPCAAVSYLNDKGLITSCEGDVPGAVSMLAAWYLSGGAPTMNDPVAVSMDDDLVQMWHCGPGPASWADEKGRTLSWHHTLNRRVKDSERPYGVSSDISFAAGPVTMVRISGDGKEIFLLEGEVVKGPSEPYCGSGGWIGNLTSRGQSCSIKRLIQTMVDHGLEHHYPIMRGHWEEEFREMAAWTGMRVIELSQHEDYLI